MKRIHWSNGKTNGRTLCGLLVYFTYIVGNIYMRVTCKTCQKLHKARQ